LRLPVPLREALARQAASEGASQTALAERYLGEAIRTADHPGIVFRSGPAGRRPAVVGGPDVWEIIGTFIAEGRDSAAAASYLGLPIGLVNAAVGYYADHASEIDGWLERNQALADEAEASARRRRAVSQA